MSRKDLKIVFMGTPDFALPVLNALYDNYAVILVITKPDAPKGRGKQMAESPIKMRAKELGIPVMTPEKVKTAEFTEELSKYPADFFVTCAYGKILPQSGLDLPKFGCINVHASILPKYRGAAPLWRMVMNGEHEGGVTTMFTEAGMDTGDMLLAEKIEIGENMTTGDVHDALSVIGGDIIIKTIDGLMEGTVERIPQNDEEATYAPTVDREDGRIDWTKSSWEIHNIVRGCNPFPGAFGILNGEKIKIWRTELAFEKRGGLPGEIVSADKYGIKVVCGNGVIRITELQTEGSKRMDAASFLNGHKISGVFDIEK